MNIFELLQITRKNQNHTPKNSHRGDKTLEVKCLRLTQNKNSLKLRDYNEGKGLVCNIMHQMHELLEKLQPIYGQFSDVIFVGKIGDLCNKIAIE